MVAWLWLHSLTVAWLTSWTWLYVCDLETYRSNKYSSGLTLWYSKRIKLAVCKMLVFLLKCYYRQVLEIIEYRKESESWQWQHHFNITLLKVADVQFETWSPWGPTLQSVTCICKAANNRAQVKKGWLGWAWLTSLFRKQDISLLSCLSSNIKTWFIFSQEFSAQNYNLHFLSTIHCYKSNQVEIS